MRMKPIAEPPGRGRGLRRREPVRREDLIDGTVAHLRSTGLAEFSPEALASHLGVTAYTLTYLFGTTDELLAAAVRHAVDRPAAEARARGAAQEGASPSDLVRCLWEWSARAENGDLVALVLEAIYATDGRSPAFHDAVREIMASGADLLASQLERSGLPAADARQVSVQVLSTLVGVHVDLIATGDEGRARAAVEELCHRVDEAARPASARLGSV